MQGLSTPLHASFRAKFIREALRAIISRPQVPGERANFYPVLPLSRLGSHGSSLLIRYVKDRAGPLLPKQAPCDVMRNSSADSGPGFSHLFSGKFSLDAGSPDGTPFAVEQRLSAWTAVHCVPMSGSIANPCMQALSPLI